MKDLDELETETFEVPTLTENLLASEFTNRHREDLLYCHQWGKWHYWDGHRWRPENTLGVYSLARQLVRDRAPENARLAARIESAATVNAIVSLARADRVHARESRDFDPDPWLLNTPAGTVELETGETRPHRRGDHITKVTAVAPSTDPAPLWSACLATWANGDTELIAFLQRLCGYWLTGSVREEKLVIVYGRGGNGKTKFIETVRACLGADYATGVAMETLVVTHGEQHPTDLADLRGKRLAIATETEEGRRLAEARVKMLTGGDTMRARYMRQDFFEFVPTHKLVIVGNHRPIIRNTDESIRRRLILIPFDAVIPEDARDSRLSEKLAAELPAILHWMIRGCLAWQRDGLNPPARVLTASEQYLEESDVVGRWIEERCVLGRNQMVTKSAAFADWKRYAEAAGEFVGNIRRLMERLVVVPGVEDERLTGGVKALRGIGLRDAE
jgi:putative DNA primase/helicase